MSQRWTDPDGDTVMGGMDSAPTEAGPAEDDGKERPLPQRRNPKRERSSSGDEAPVRRFVGKRNVSNRERLIRKIANIVWTEINPEILASYPKHWSRAYYHGNGAEIEPVGKKIGVYALKSTARDAKGNVVTIAAKLLSFAQAVSNGDLTNIAAMAAPRKVVEAFSDDDRKVLTDGMWVRVDILREAFSEKDKDALEQNGIWSIAEDNDLVFLVYDWHYLTAAKLAREIGQGTASIGWWPDQLDRLLARFEIGDPGAGTAETQVAFPPFVMENVDVREHWRRGPGEDRFGDSALAENVFFVYQDNIERSRRPPATKASAIEFSDLAVGGNAVVRAGRGGIPADDPQRSTFLTSSSEIPLHPPQDIGRLVILPKFRERGLCARVETREERTEIVDPDTGLETYEWNSTTSVVIMKIPEIPTAPPSQGGNDDDAKDGSDAKDAYGEVQDVYRLELKVPKVHKDKLPQDVDSTEATVIRGASDRAFSIVITLTVKVTNKKTEEETFIALMKPVAVFIDGRGSVQRTEHGSEWSEFPFTEVWAPEANFAGSTAVIPVITGDQTTGLCACFVLNNYSDYNMGSDVLADMVVSDIKIVRKKSDGTVVGLQTISDTIERTPEAKRSRANKVDRAINQAIKKCRRSNCKLPPIDLQGVIIGDVFAFSYLHRGALQRTRTTTGAVAAMAYVGELGGHEKLIPIEFKDSHRFQEVHPTPLSHAGSRVGIIAVDASFVEKHGTEKMKGWGPAFGFVQTRTRLRASENDEHIREVRLVIGRAPPDVKFEDESGSKDESGEEKSA